VSRPARATQLRGLMGTARLGGISSRALAISDSRSLVRALFLGSAAETGILTHLSVPRRLDELAGLTGTRRPERLEAWLGVGCELRELRLAGGRRYALRGRRARALAAGDRLLVAHYRSMLEYQVGPYASLRCLLRDDPGSGRDDLERYAEDIAEVSRAAEPFVASMLTHLVRELRPGRVLDAGCGSGVHTATVLDADPAVRVVGIDLAPGVVEHARRELADRGLQRRVELHVGDVRGWITSSEARFDLVLLLNNVYYFPPEDRVALYRSLGASLVPGGSLLVVSMTVPGSIAAAHLHLMLVSQAGRAALPGGPEITSDLGEAGLEVVTDEVLVPAEPFVAVRAVRR
jgi:SAM-dependent methyltransferase